MNRRNFLTSLIVAVPAISLGLRGKAAPVEIVVPKQERAVTAGTSLFVVGNQSLGDWMAQEHARDQFPSMTYEEFKDIEHTLKEATKGANGWNGYVKLRNPVASTGRTL